MSLNSSGCCDDRFNPPIKAAAAVRTVITPGDTGGIVVTAKGNGRAISSDEIVISTNDRPLHVLLTLSSRDR